MADSHRAAVYLDKGGTGKTTTVAHLGVTLTHEDYDVLLCDLAGKQSDLAKQFGVYQQIPPDDDRWPNIATIFQPEWPQIASQLDTQRPIDALTVPTGEGPDLLPAHQGLDSLDVELESKFSGGDKFRRLEQFLGDYADPHYDVVLFDLPGAPNNVTYNGVFAARHVFAPVEAGEFEYKQAQALRDDIDRMNGNFAADIDLTMIVLNKLDQQTNLADEYTEKYADEFGVVMGPTAVPKSQDIRNAVADGQTVFALETPSRTAERARTAYRETAAELMERIA